jgi:hypothetical protein
MPDGQSNKRTTSNKEQHVAGFISRDLGASTMRKYKRQGLPCRRRIIASRVKIAPTPRGLGQGLPEPSQQRLVTRQCLSGLPTAAVSVFSGKCRRYCGKQNIPR